MPSLFSCISRQLSIYVTVVIAVLISLLIGHFNLDIIGSNLCVCSFIIYCYTIIVCVIITTHHIQNTLFQIGIAIGFCIDKMGTSVSCNSYSVPVCRTNGTFKNNLGVRLCTTYCIYVIFLCIFIGVQWSSQIGIDVVVCMPLIYCTR